MPHKSIAPRRCLIRDAVISTSIMACSFMSHQYTTPQLTAAIEAVSLWRAFFFYPWLGLIPFALSPAILWPASLDHISHLACNMIPHDYSTIWYKLALGSYLLRTFHLAIAVFSRYNVVLISWDAVSKRGTCSPAYPCEVKLDTTLQSEPLALKFYSMS